MKIIGKSQGFSLMELIVVLALISILAAIATPLVLNWLPNMQLKGAARELFTTLHKAKMGAIKENQNWAVVFDVINNEYRLVSDWGGANTLELTVGLNDYHNGIQYGGGTTLFSVTGAAFVDGVSYINNRVVFNFRGIGSGGYIYLENDKQDLSYAVGTRTSGVIRLLKSQGAGWPP